MSDAPPVLSILIPNFNNGRKSSLSGDRDFIADLFQSLLDTLTDDPTPLEILVADDGSSDDSLETCRKWAQREWPGWREGQPFCRLTEHEHCGILSIVANRLTTAARGEICCRLDGDIIVNTPNWAEKIVSVFRNSPPELGVVGPKQLGLDGRIHSAGSWILHPRGHHHIAQGAISQTVTRTMEVDHVMGCFYCHKREVWEQLNGYDESILRGQTVDFGLRARLCGWRTFVVPNVEFTHAHAQRARRQNRADTHDGVETTLDQFAEKWGFDRLAPDLDVVAERYAGTPLLWNAKVFGPATPWPPLSNPDISIRQTEWARYANDETYRYAVDVRVKTLLALKTRFGPRRRVAQVRCRSGLFCHLAAKLGMECVGIDADEHLLNLARVACQQHEYRAARPSFVRQTDRRRLPFDNGSFDTVALLDLLETHSNPVALFAETWRVLSPGGVMWIVTKERTTPFGEDYDTLHAYRTHELVMQIQGSRYFEALPLELDPPIPGAIVVCCRRRDEEHRTYYLHRKAEVAETEEVVASV